ncbi:MAG: HIT domain-containing protein [Holosporales bacterium]|jgi:histidine triad (HIT) family protein|nr:HIT domain-containing protein [Holosporales bacterium]
MVYDKNNVFYKIIHGDIKSEVVLNTKHCIAIHDIQPKAPIHILVIPKGEYITYDEFINKASEYEILDLQNQIVQIVNMFNLKKSGYQIVVNNGKFAKQEVPHVHIHVMGKKV